MTPLVNQPLNSTIAAMWVNEFRGTFNGGGNTISNLHIYELTDYQGLFGLVYGGIYKNIILDSAFVVGGSFVGMLIGAANPIATELIRNNPELYDKATRLSIINNCHVSGRVYGFTVVGGIAGRVFSQEINTCSSSGSICSEGSCGGLFGLATLGHYMMRPEGNNYYLDGFIRNCYSRCDVTGGPYDSGGLIGRGESSVVENCYSTGNVKGHIFTGGLIGESYTVKNCYAAGNTIGTGYWCLTSGSITTCGQRTGSIVGASGSGGEVGTPLLQWNRIISNCYGLADFGNHPFVGLSSNGNYPTVSDTASFTIANGNIELLNNVTVGQTNYNNLLDALNAYVDTYDTLGVFLHWVADTTGENNGFPILEKIRYNTISVHVADSTPHGSVSGGGTYSSAEHVIISATPDYGYHFVQWNDGNTDNPRTIYLKQDTSFTATFSKNMYSIVGTTNVSIDYQFDFEDNLLDQQWTLQNGNNKNRWYISNPEDTNRVLFISYDYGESNTYDRWTTSCTYAYTTLHLLPGEYNYNYVWYGYSNYRHFMRVVLIPASIDFYESVWSSNSESLPSDVIFLHDNHSYLSTSSMPLEWTNINGKLQISEDGDYKLVVQWYNNGDVVSGGPDAVAIDNIHIYNSIPEEENNHGYVLGSDTVPYLDTVMITAVPYEGYGFVSWCDGNMDNPRTIVATTDKYYVATFAQCPDTTKILAKMPENGYIYDGQTYTQSGVYHFNYVATHGCDSVVCLTLYDSIITLCDNHFPFTYGETTFDANTVDGLYPLIFNGQNSYVYIHIKPTAVYDTIASCDNSYVYVGNVCFHDSLPGDYVVNLQGSCGCDSIINLHYKVNPSFTFDVYDTIPIGTGYNNYGISIPADWTQRQIDLTAFRFTSEGCDSIYRVHLTITDIPVYYVAKNGTGDGSSWENAMGDLQTALAGEGLRDIWVAGGTYYGDGVSENAFIIPTGTHIYGGFAGNEPVDYDLSLRNFAAHPTILDGQHLQRAVKARDEVVLDGLTIKNGIGNDCNLAGSAGVELVNSIVQGGQGGSVISNTTIRNSIIHNNNGLIHSCQIINSIIVNNTSQYPSSSISYCGLTNCIVWNNIGNIYNAPISYSAVGDQYIYPASSWGEGNIYIAHNNDGSSPDSNYVRFVDPENGDFRLAEGSACINTGTPDISELGLPSVDLQGLPRVLGGRIDMGAYEFFSLPTFHLYDTICDGDNLTFRDSVFSTAGNHIYHCSSIPLRDTVYVLHLTVNYPMHTAVTETACESYTWNGTTYTLSGDYTFNHPDANGCTQVDTLHLTINKPAHTAVTEVACESYTWNGTTYTVSGNYTFSHTDDNGCIQVDTLHLTINNPVHTSVTETACETYSWNGTTYTLSGDYTFSHPDANGCIQVDTLHLSINNPVSTAFAETACESFTWNSTTYSQSGDFSQMFTATNGCDSLVTLHLTINSPVNTDVSETACGSYEWNGITYSESGVYTQTFTNAVGCDSVVTLSLTLLHEVDTVIHDHFCNGSAYAFFGQELYSPGIYTYVGQTVHGCDSTVTLHLEMKQTYSSFTNVNLCNGEGYDFYGETLYNAGTYTQVLPTVFGCDSTIILTVTTGNTTYGTLNASICNGNSYLFHGQHLTEAGDYTITLTNAAGCDSVVTLHLTVNSPVYTSITEVSCESYTWNGTMHTQSGDYTHTFTASNGCDSIVTLHLTVYDDATSEFTITTPDSCYTWNDQTYCTSGDYTQTLQTVHGCDSVVTLHLTITVGLDDYDGFDFKVYPNPTSNIVNVECLMTNGELGEMELHLCDAYGRLLDVVRANNDSPLRTALIDLSRYANGVYFIKAVADGETIAVRKVVKE